MTTRKDYHEELAIYQGIYQQHIKPIEDFYTPKVNYLFNAFFFSMAFLFGFLILEQPALFTTCGIIGAVCVLTGLALDLTEQSKIKTKSLEINLPKEPLLKDVYINDSFRFKASRFENPKTIKILDIDLDYSKVKTECGLVLTFNELKEHWTLLEDS